MGQGPGTATSPLLTSDPVLGASPVAHVAQPVLSYHSAPHWDRAGSERVKASPTQHRIF